MDTRLSFISKLCSLGDTLQEEERGYLLVALVDLDVPPTPDLGRGEHATGAAHVTEGSLTGTVGTTTRDTGNTGNSTTSSPRLSRGLVTSLLADGVWLALVLGHTSVHLLDDIRSDGAQENRGDGGGGTTGLAIFADDTDGRTRGHCENVRVVVRDLMEGR